MPQQERVPSAWEHVAPASDEPRIQLKSTGQGLPCFTFTFELIRSNVFRTTFTSDSHPLPPHPSILIPPATQQGLRAETQAGSSGSSKLMRIGDIVATVDWGASSSSSPVVSASYAASLDTPFPVRKPDRVWFLFPLVCCEILDKEVDDIV